MKPKLLFALSILLITVVAVSAQEQPRGDLIYVEPSVNGIVIPNLWGYYVDPVTHEWVVGVGTYAPLPLRGNPMLNATVWWASFNGPTWRPVLVIGWTNGVAGPYTVNVTIGDKFAYTSLGQQQDGVATYLWLFPYKLGNCGYGDPITGFEGKARVLVEFSDGTHLKGHFRYASGLTPDGETLPTDPPPIPCD